MAPPTVLNTRCSCHSRDLARPAQDIHCAVDLRLERICEEEGSPLGEIVPAEPDCGDNAEANTSYLNRKEKPTVTNTRTEEDDETDQLLSTSRGIIGFITDFSLFQSICFRINSIYEYLLFFPSIFESV